MSEQKKNEIYKQVVTFKDNKWGTRNFELREHWIAFLEEQFKFVGQYNLKNTKDWVQPRTHFLTFNKYTKIIPKTKEYKNFWINEGFKCNRGVIFNDVYVSGAYYFYLNFVPIVSKETDKKIAVTKQSKVTFPEIWDSDLYFFHYLSLCDAYGLFAIITKKRQWGFSYKNSAIMGSDLWFLNEQRIKILAVGDGHLADIWGKMNDLKSHLQSFTGWKRLFGVNKDATRKWEMKWKTSNEEGESFVGRMNSIAAIISTGEITKAVGGYNTRIYFEESGLDPNLDKKISFAKSSIMVGNIVTGAMVVGGSVGELKDCEPLRRMSYNPKDYNFLGVYENDKSDKLRCLFIASQYNYTHGVKDEKTGVTKTIKCYDEDGNSDVELALQYILEEREKKKSDPATLQTEISQHPITLDEAFNSRDSNIFPVQLISKQRVNLLDKKQITVKIIEDAGKLKLQYENLQIVNELRLKANSFREPSIVIVEPPIDNPPKLLYFGGIDPVKELKGVGESLMSCYIYRNDYEKTNSDGSREIVAGRIVAYCTGRFFDDKDTFLLFRNLIKIYSCASTIENDQPSFIDYMRYHKEYNFMLRRGQIPILKELSPNSSISNDEWGIRMNTGGTISQVKKHIHLAIISYCKEIIGTRTVNGIVENIYGVERITDPMLLEELLNHQGEVGKDEGNYDRICAFGLALLTANCYNTLHIKHKSSNHIEQKEVISVRNSNLREITSFNRQTKIFKTNRFNQLWK